MAGGSSPCPPSSPSAQAGNLELGIGANHDLIFVVDLYAVIDPHAADAGRPTRAEPTTPASRRDTTETDATPSTETTASRPSEPPRHASRRRRREPTATVDREPSDQPTEPSRLADPLRLLVEPSG